MRIKSRHDANHVEIVRYLTAIGCTVVDLSRVGGGCPDLLVGYHGKTWFVEIKTPAGRLSDNQTEFAAWWRGCPVLVVRSGPDAIKQLEERQ